MKIDNLNKTQLRKAGKFKEVAVLKKADEAHHAFKNDMRDLFKSNSKFAEAFVFEAMTGKVKFDDSVGTAEYFLVTDFERKVSTPIFNTILLLYKKKIIFFRA